MTIKTWSQAQLIMNDMITTESDAEFAGLAALLEDLYPFVLEYYANTNPGVDVDSSDWSFLKHLDRLKFSRTVYLNYVAGTLSNHATVFDSRQDYDSKSLRYVCKFNINLPDGAPVEVRVIFGELSLRGEMVIFNIVLHGVGSEPILLALPEEEHLGAIFSGLLDLLVRMHVN